MNCRNVVTAFAVTFFVLFFSASCKSTDLATEAENHSPILSDSHTQNLSRSSYFSDWTYRGFGKELPSWAESAFLGGASLIKEKCPDFSDADIVLYSAAGKNADHVMTLLSEQIPSSENSRLNLRLVDVLWVRLTNDSDIKKAGGEYVAFALLMRYL